MLVALGEAAPDRRPAAVLRASLAGLASVLAEYAKHLLARSIYVGTSVAVLVPVVVVPEPRSYGSAVLAPAPWLVVPYVSGGFVPVMVEFTVLRRRSLAWRTVVFHVLLGEADRDERRPARH
jgi:hypothetical protein